MKTARGCKIEAASVERLYSEYRDIYMKAKNRTKTASGLGITPHAD